MPTLSTVSTFVVLKNAKQMIKPSFSTINHLSLLRASTSTVSRCDVSTEIQDKYFISTPIFYVNSSPHIGHLYSALLADAHARFRKLKDPSLDFLFSTGTDEHGLKIQQAAANAGTNPDKFCTDVSSRFRHLFDSAGITYTDFIRTTEARHKATVSKVWKKLMDDEHLYRDVYSSWYSVQDEAFLTSSQVEERNGCHYSLESGHRVEWAEEENWCFRLKNQREKVLKWIVDERPIQPQIFESQVKVWLEESKSRDLSVSRPLSRLQWGIPVPSSIAEPEASDTIYVWLDALVNYLTVAGYGEEGKNLTWPPTVQVIGKDILKFHAVYWPSFLLALNLPLPKRLLVHSHWMVDDVKMSKSLGNVVDPIQLIERYSVDGTRYMLLREGVPHSDGNFSLPKMVNYLNGELADTLGNLLNRSSSKGVNPNQTFPKWKEHFKDYESTYSTELKENLENLPTTVENAFENFNFYQGIVAIMDTLRLANIFLQEEKPWDLRKNGDNKRLEFVLTLSLESLRVSGILLSPIVPTISQQLLSKLSVPVAQRTFHQSKELCWNTGNYSRDLGPDKVMLFKKIRE